MEETLGDARGQTVNLILGMVTCRGKGEQWAFKGRLVGGIQGAETTHAYSGLMPNPHA